MNRSLIACALLSACGLTRPHGAVDGGTGGGGGGTGGGDATGGGNTAGGNNTAGGGAGGATAGGGSALESWHLDEIDTGGASSRFLAVQGISPTDFWTLGSDGTVFHSNGSTFAAVSGATNATSMATTPAGDVFLMSAAGPVVCNSGCRAAGSIFDPGTLPGTSTYVGASVCADAVHGVFAAANTTGANNTAVFFFVGGAWSRVYFSSNVPRLRSCFITATGRAHVPGLEAVVVAQSDGGSSNLGVSPGQSEEQWVAGTGTDAGLVIGGEGWRIATREVPGVLSWVRSGPPDAGGVVRAVVRLGEGNDVFAGGTYENGRSITIRRDGTWRPLPAPIDVYGAWAVSETELFIAGSALDGGGARLLHGTWR